MVHLYQSYNLNLLEALFKKTQKTIKMENEIWKEYPANTDYSVSSLGRVKVKARLDKSGHKRIGKILKNSLANHGYYNVKIEQSTRTVHQLVAETFLGHKPDGMKLVVNHINFNQLDNKASNLEIISQRANSNKKHLKTSSKYTGVTWSKQSKQWISQIVIDSKKKYLGIFRCELAASNAYQTALKEL